MSPEDWTRTQGELQGLRDFRREYEAKLELERSAGIRALAEKGQIEEALKQQREHYERQLAEHRTAATRIESEWLGERKQTLINSVLAGRTFVGVDPQATADLVRRLLEGEIEAVRDTEGKPLIRDRKTLRPAADYLKERLDSPEFGVFFAPTHRGGAGTDGARPAAATPNSQPPPQEGSFEAFAEAYKARREAAQTGRSVIQQR